MFLVWKVITAGVVSELICVYSVVSVLKEVWGAPCLAGAG